MNFKPAILAALLPLAAHAQTLLVVTNIRSTVAGDPAYTLSGPAGAFRMTYSVESTPGVPMPLNDGSSLRLEVWAADGRRDHYLTNDVTPAINAAGGQVRFAVPELAAGTYRLRGVATPADGNTNAAWNLTHHYLTVTSAPAAVVNISATNNISADVNITNVIQSTLIINVEGNTVAEIVQP